METKICKICNLDKPITEYNKRSDFKDGYYKHCKSCNNFKNKIYRENNKEKESIRGKVYRNKNKEQLKLNRNLYLKKNKDKITISKTKYVRNRIATDPLYKLTFNIRRAICNSFVNNNYKKNTKTATILGCSFDEFKTYLESQFESWMSWDNHGLYNGTPDFGWDIDHIAPISSAKTEDDVIRLNHYTNLRPLCSYINRVVKRNTTF